MACPGCIVAVAGTDGLGADSAAPSKGSFIAGAVVGAMVTWFVMWFVRGATEKGYGPDPHEVFRNARLRRRRR